MREFTSAAANKMIRSLEDDKAYYLTIEEDSCVYILAEGEKGQAPDYDYRFTQDKIEEIDDKIRKIKHALNVFNVTTMLDGLDITIDEALVEMAQLNRKKVKLDGQRMRLPKKRVGRADFGTSNFIEYEYVNYDIKLVQEDYHKVSECIMAIQMALDLTNQTKTFSIEI